jgi:hypothetical protein
MSLVETCLNADPSTLTPGELLLHNIAYHIDSQKVENNLTLDDINDVVNPVEMICEEASDR